MLFKASKFRSFKFHGNLVGEDWKVICEEESLIPRSQTHETNFKWGKLEKHRNGDKSESKANGENCPDKEEMPSKKSV